MKLIDYTNPDEFGAVRSICIGCLTANVGAIISLTLIDKQPADLQSALANFAATLPLLGSSAAALDRAITSLAAGRPLAGWPSHLVTACTGVGLYVTVRGYMLFMQHYSEKALWSFAIALVVATVMMFVVMKYTKRR
jgi:hypothetical protein